MCGIAGEVRFSLAPDPEAARRMGDALVHRGPDAGALYQDHTAALAHRRLSILDLEGGAQPMERGDCVLVFNGEAYRHEALRRVLEGRGHVFTTRSDTEVVLVAYLEWGEDFIERVDGMFALALFDRRQQKLLLARDRMGKKPLYYALARGKNFLASPPDEERALVGVDRLVFASELKAFTAHCGVPREL